MKINIQAIAREDPLYILEGKEDEYGAESKYLGFFERKIEAHFVAQGMTPLGTQFSPTGALTLHVRGNETAQVKSNLNDTDAKTCLEILGPEETIQNLQRELVKERPEISQHIILERRI